MLQKVLDSIGSHLESVSGTFLKDGIYTNVIQDIRGVEVYPAAYVDSRRDPLPMFQDHKANYGYIRTIGESSFGEFEQQFSGNVKTYLHSTPCRLVLHYSQSESGDNSRQVVDLFLQLLKKFEYSIPASSLIISADAEPTGANSDRLQVFRNETSGLELKMRHNDRIVSIDFNLEIVHQDSKCIETDICTGNLPYTVITS